ncbi:MAG: AMP-binding protein [Niveispirillum sp.]|uniref:AMP-binding protein n=1 Tax=Niveispirillum sp. TaxID=1917217 RepID=UPI003BA45CC1
MATIAELAAVGLLSHYYAEVKPEETALIAAGGTRSFRALHENANRLAHVLRDLGLRAGDAVALLLGNQPEFVEAYMAALRIGLRVTPINWHLTGPEVAYIVADCDAGVLIADNAFTPAAQASVDAVPSLRVIMVGPGGPGWLDYAALLAAASPQDPLDPSLGIQMLYTSGTTGQPKGVLKRVPEIMLPQGPGTVMAFQERGDVSLCCGPLYHAAPLLADMRWPLASGVPIVLMPKWDAEQALALVARHRVTHTHMVPTMFQRLLTLPKLIRDRYDISSLRRVTHGAAPCPRDVKRSMIDWFGPVLLEYYAATEGGGGFQITSEEWLAKPGSVGRLWPAFGASVRREDGSQTAAGEVGLVYLKASAEGRFEYHKDPEKTAALFQGDDFTLGDMGYLDEDGYLFLTGRTAELIISGGVNIYPQEVDDAIARHPAVAEVCTIGLPNREWGEEVRTLVVPAPGWSPSAALATEIIAFARQHLAGFKCPRQIDFTDNLPRLASGKIQRRQVKARYGA